MSIEAQNLQNVRTSVQNAALAAGRDPGEVLIVAVSKTFGDEKIRAATEAGQTHFGENYAREFKRKATDLADLGLKWHFIGHLQSNKARDVVGRTHLVHSLDRKSLAREIQKRAEAADVTVDVLVEVRTTDEATKSGILPAELFPFVKELDAFDRLCVRGLMTMGPFTDEPEDARPCFMQLRELRERLRQEGPDRMIFEHLSMGMTSDFTVAIEEGSTIVRIGTAIFGQRTPHEG